jgi:Tfp pilus assembly protein PilO
MDKLKQYVVFTVLGCLVVLAAGWFLLVSPKRSDAQALRSDRDAAQASNNDLLRKLQVLKAQAKNLPKEQAKLAAVAARIPDNTAMPALVRALTGAAKSAGIELVSVTPSAPVVVAGAAAAAPAAPAATGAKAAVPATGSAAASASAGQLASIPLTLSIAGGYFQVEQFVANLENLPRAMRLNNLAIAPGINPVKPTSAATVDDGKSLLSTVTGQVFMAVNRPKPTAVTVPGAVAGTAVGPAAPVTPAKK